MTWHAPLNLLKSGVKSHYSPVDRFLWFVAPFSDGRHRTKVTTEVLHTSLWDSSLSKEGMELSSQLSVHWTCAQVLTMPLKAAQKPSVSFACRLLIPFCLLPYHTGASISYTSHEFLFFRWTFLRVRNLSRFNAESLTWIQVAAGLQCPWMSIGEALVPLAHCREGPGWPPKSLPTLGPAAFRLSTVPFPVYSRRLLFSVMCTLHSFFFIPRSWFPNIYFLSLFLGILFIY